MFLLVLAHPGCPVESPESLKMVVVVAVFTGMSSALCNNVMTDTLVLDWWNVLTGTARNHQNAKTTNCMHVQS